MTNKPIHILFIPSWYSKIEDPMKGTFFRDQAKSIYDQGLKVGIVYSESDRSLNKLSINMILKNHFQNSIDNDEGILVYRHHGWNVFPGMPKLRLRLLTITTMRLIDKYIKDNGKPDILHAQSALWAGYIALIASKKYKIPYILTEHYSGYARGLIKSWEKEIANDIMQNSCKNIAVSNYFANLLNNMFKLQKKDFKVLPNMVDVDYFRLPSSKRAQEPFVFLNIGFLTPNKGINLLIKAFNTAFKDNYNVVLKIGGDGEQRQQLESLVKEFHLENKVIFLGLLDRQAVREAMWNANAFIISSHIETFGVVAIEALSTGIPVIATKCGGPEDIITSDDIGMLVNEGDLNAMATALKNLYNNYEKYNNIEIRKYVSNRFSSRIISNSILNIYDQVIHEKRY